MEVTGKPNYMKMVVVTVGNKQYLVREGDQIKTEKIREKKGKLALSEVLLYTDGRRVVIKPDKLKKVKVEAEVVGTGKGKKIRIVKHKAKKGYLKRQGHRQPYFLIKINKIKL